MSRLALTKLTDRKLLRIKGPDCYPYLQGLLCNDLRYLYEPDKIPKRKHAKVSPNVLSTYMLNAQGRAICDLLVYRTPLTRYQCEFTPPGKATEYDELLIECDAKLASGLANTLYGYRVRRKIEMSSEDDYHVWCLYPTIDQQSTAGPQKHPAIEPTELSLPPSFEVTQEVISDGMIVVNDPRLMSLGMRILTKTGDFDALKSSIQNVINADIVEKSLKKYIYHRYTLGIGEGSNDLPESNCLPLECNADYLGSVSFTKGCYLGQELTSRIHHTGVVRKRLMPIILDLKTRGTSDLSASMPYAADSLITDETGRKKIGALRYVVKDRALALLRFEKLNDVKGLIHDATRTHLQAYKPYWWKN